MIKVDNKNLQFLFNYRAFSNVLTLLINRLPYDVLIYYTNA